MSGDDLKLLQGTLDVLVLKAVAFGPRHGYAVAEWIRRRTDEALQVEEGALYTSLHRMEKRKWLRAEWGLSDNNRRAKFYSLTAQGNEALDNAERTWERYSDAVTKVLGSSGGDL